MNELIKTLKELLGSTVALRYKAHGYHWNVETDDFPQWHDKFAEIYESLDDSIDPLAEWIRMLGDYAPFKLSRFLSLSSIPESDVTSEPEDMAADLYKDHVASAAAFGAASVAAGNAGQKGLENFLADCMTTHQKWAWQLRASLSEEMMETPQMESSEGESTSTAPTQG
jgi:starvation-inducible DNA-binding protein